MNAMVSTTVELPMLLRDHLLSLEGCRAAFLHIVEAQVGLQLAKEITGENLRVVVARISTA